MTTSSLAVRRTRRALTGMGIVAASMLFLAPVAGAERPGTAAVAEGESSRGGPSARSSTPSGEPEGQPDVVAGERAAPSPESTGRYEHTLCHRTGSAADPYVRITVAFRTANGEVVSSDGGHENHDGPVFDPATMGEGDTWGDIIPPFTTPDGVSYEGKNWPVGAATFDNGCEPVGWTDPAEPTVADGGRTPDRAEVPASPGDVTSDEERKALDRDDQEDALDERAVAVPRQPDTRTRQSFAAAGGSAGAVGERALTAGGATGDIAAVLGQHVTRDLGDGEVVPAADSESVLATELARTDTTLLVLLMLGLSVLIGGYAAVGALRDRMRRTE